MIQSHIRLFLGASSAVARQMAEIYAKNGNELILAGRDKDDLERTASHFRVKYHIPATALYYDALDIKSHPEFVQAIRDIVQDKILNIIALSAIMPEQSLMDYDVQKAVECIDTGFTGLVSVIHPLANDLEAKKSGSIIIFGSVAGDRGRLGNYIYGATKAGLHCYASGLRNRLARAEVHVMTVKPGFIDTVMTRGKKLPPLPMATPQTVAKRVIKCANKKCNTVYIPFFWRVIMGIICLIPERYFKKMRI